MPNWGKITQWTEKQHQHATVWTSLSRHSCGDVTSQSGPGTPWLRGPVPDPTPVQLCDLKQLVHLR